MTDTMAERIDAGAASQEAGAAPPAALSAQERQRAAYTTRLRQYADMLDNHPEIKLPDRDLPLPDSGPLVTLSYLDQFKAAAEFLERTGVPLHRYSSLTIYWHADSSDEVDRIAALGEMTPEWNKDGSRYEAIKRLGHNLEYKVTYHKRAAADSEATPAAETVVAA